MSKTKNYPVEILDELAYGGEAVDLVVVGVNFHDKGRWSISWEMVFVDKLDNSFWKAWYREPATEYQECERWARESLGMVECIRVYPFAKTVTEYREE